MKKSAVFVALAAFSTLLHAASDNPIVTNQMTQLQQQTEALQREVQELKRQVQQNTPPPQPKRTANAPTPAASRPAGTLSSPRADIHDSPIRVHALNRHPETMGFYPTALLADGQVITYIAGTPVISTPYTGDRPAFDGSDYIVNISSINRDIRLMQQRRKLYAAYSKLGYPPPPRPILALSGKVEPFGYVVKPYIEKTTGDLSLGASELDVAAVLNENVEAFFSLAYDDSPPQIDGPRVSNSRFFLNMGFVNIGNLDKTPWYMTTGQLFAPFGRYSSAMISAPLPMRLGRIKTRPLILGYKTQHGPGLFAALFGFKSEATLGRSGAAGLNLGYIFEGKGFIGELGASFVSSLTDAGGMQYTGSGPRRTFGGFSSVSNGNQRVRKIPGVDVRGSINIDGYNFIGEWVGASQRFPEQDLSFNLHGAQPQAGQLEVNKTFMVLNKPASIGAGYQWSSQALALGLPRQSLLAVFNISIWKDTVESIEYRHNRDYRANQQGNGIAPTGQMNEPVIGTGKSSDTLALQLGVYF
ncbi:MAG: LbtU family siderophore porin [Legionellaceae bacterium]|nr:LbtU family siderophore porin [Legionellaceae bacterium]